MISKANLCLFAAISAVSIMSIVYSQDRHHNKIGDRPSGQVDLLARETNAEPSPLVPDHPSQLLLPRMSQSVPHRIHSLRPPANLPQEFEPQTALSQDDARRLEQYMIQYNQGPPEHNPINLAHINDRSIRRPEQIPPVPTDHSLPQRFSNEVPQASSQQQRSDKVQMVIEPQVRSEPTKDIQTKRRTGRLDDVVIFNKEAKSIGHRHLAHKHIGLTLPPGCISRAAPLTSKCEDHLIKRLNQDATEGRTVLDVSRRLCCALFWHKECISAVVVQNCPDSNPQAASLLLGSRNIDLTMSCQRFNRDGCNGSLGKSNHGVSLVLWFIVVAVAICLCLANLSDTHVHIC